MRETCKTILCKLCSSAILAGLVLFVIGLYYMVIKARLWNYRSSMPSIWESGKSWYRTDACSCWELA